MQVVLAVALVLIGGVIQWWLQKREFDNRQTEWRTQQRAEQERWTDQRRADEQRWHEQVDAEHRRFLLTERRQIYSAVITAMRRVGMVGQKVGGEVTSGKHQSDTLARWEDALTQYVGANSQVMLLGSPEFIEAARAAALTAWSVPFPTDQPELWTQGDDGSPSAGLLTWGRATQGMREVARREFGLPSIPDPPPTRTEEI